MQNKSDNQVVVVNSRDFVLMEHEHFYRSILIKDGNLTVKPYAAFLDQVTLISPQKSVLLESHSFIYHLNMMNGGEIFFTDDNILIDHLTIEGHVVIHLPKSSSVDLQDLVDIISGVCYTIARDID